MVTPPWSPWWAPWTSSTGSTRPSTSRSRNSRSTGTGFLNFDIGMSDEYSNEEEEGYLALSSKFSKQRSSVKIFVLWSQARTSVSISGCLKFKSANKRIFIAY